MLYAALGFLVAAIITGALGFGSGVVHTATLIAQGLFFVFIACFVVALLTSLLKG